MDTTIERRVTIGRKREKERDRESKSASSLDLSILNTGIEGHSNLFHEIEQCHTISRNVYLFISLQITLALPATSPAASNGAGLITDKKTLLARSQIISL